MNSPPESTGVPRIALLTWCSPASRYAGGAAVRRLLGCLPREQVRWCGFHAGATGSNLPLYEAFAPLPVHWRLSGSLIEELSVNVFQSRAIATRMWRWLQPFDPQVLWVFPEMWAVSVGLALHHLSGLPLHLTVHDAPETALGATSRLFLPTYRARVRHLLAHARSLDTVSDGLVNHLRTHYAFPPDRPALVIPPCVESELILTTPVRAWLRRPERHIALCGSLRIGHAQWDTFLATLARLPHPVVLDTFTDEGDLPASALPANVTIAHHAYQETEAEMIHFLAARADAAYLGVWREPSRQLFGRTSLSSKLTTYAAAGLPVLVDAEADSVAWQLVSRYGAGIRLDPDPAASAPAIQSLLGDGSRWEQASAGARRLCLDAFDLDSHAGLLRNQLCRIARP